jgi:arsenite transporter
MPLLAWIARNGRLMLLAGLALGIALPGLATALRPGIAPMIVALLFLAVLRLGPQGIRSGLKGLGRAAGLALVLQLALPLGAVALFAALGVLAHPLATGTVLALAAAPITGSPNITLMAGGDPTPALRQLVTGTTLLPLTVIPVFFLVPAFGSPAAVTVAALKLLGLIALAGGVALILRGSGIVTAGERSVQVMDAAAALLLGLVVIGMMSAVGPALIHDTPAFLAALGVAFALNFPLQMLAARIAARRDPAAAPALGIVAGNRNIGLFISVLPVATADQLLLFIGCFQIPMYLTPFLLTGWYRRIAAREPAG